MSSIHSFFTYSAVTNEYFRDAQRKLKLDTTTTLKLWSDTRWDSIDSLIRNYSAVLQVFEDIIEGKNSRSVNARCLLISVKEPIFIVTLFILYKLMGPIKILSNQLKSETIDYGKANSLISSTTETIKHFRNEQSFKLIYDQIVDFSQAHDIDLKQKRKRSRAQIIPSHSANSIITSTLDHRDDDINDEHRFRISIFYPLIDSILVELNDRFSNTNLHLLESLAAMYPENDQFSEFKSLCSLANHLNCDLNQLQNELNVMKPMIKDGKN